MKPSRPLSVVFCAVVAGGWLAAAGPAQAESSWRDAIAGFLAGEAPQTPQQGGEQTAESRSGVAAGESGQQGTPPDPRAGDPTYEQAQRLMQAIDAILNDAARNRGEASKLPSKNDFLVPPMFTETREDRDLHVRRLLDSALGIVTDVPIVELQDQIATKRKNISELRDQIAELGEKKLSAPKDAILPGVLTDTVDSLQRKIEELERRIEENQTEIAKIKDRIRQALADAGITMEPSQVDLLVDSVLSDDLIRLVAIFNSAKLIDRQLADRMKASGENMTAARKYFAMHAALFAMLLRSQDLLIEKIDTQYLPKLDAIRRDIKEASDRTKALLREDNRPDQERVLKANQQSQKLASQAAEGYRRYLMQQRQQIAAARSRAAHDLRIADNTYETVEASYQLQLLMRDAASTFDALEKLEAPTFEEIFQNEELRREFENLTRKLEVPTS